MHPRALIVTLAALILTAAASPAPLPLGLDDTLAQSNPAAANLAKNRNMGCTTGTCGPPETGVDAGDSPAEEQAKERDDGTTSLTTAVETEPTGALTSETASSGSSSNGAGVRIGSSGGASVVVMVAGLVVGSLL